MAKVLVYIEHAHGKLLKSSLVAVHAGLEAAKKDGDTLGGIVEVLAYGLPPGLGSHVQWDRRLDGKLYFIYLLSKSTTRFRSECTDCTVEFTDFWGF